MNTIRDQYAATFSRSAERFEQARQLFPSGVTHDLRMLDPFPVYIDRAKGARKWDIQGHEFIDYWNGHGSLILGHCPDDVTAAVREQAGKATHPGGCHELEIQWGELVRKLVPGAEKVRFTSSGTEATLMAMRVVRMATGKPKILKFKGHFHGWHDAAMPAAYHPYDGSPVPGVPDPVMAQTVVIEPNDAKLVEKTLIEQPEIGGVILEPTGGHWGQVPIRGPFLQALRDVCTKLGRILIFDEVITGFRVSPGGAAQHYGVTADLTTLAKILAGGLPGGAVAGRADLLAVIEQRPGQQKMRHPGTYNGNPLSAAAGIAALTRVATGEPTTLANAAGAKLKSALNAMFVKANYDWICYGDFSLLHLIPNYAGPRPTGEDFIPYDGSVAKLDAPKNSASAHTFRQAMLLNGIDVPGYGLWLTACHGDAEIAATVAAVERAVGMVEG